jgi:hypothetical protein
LIEPVSDVWKSAFSSLISIRRAYFAIESHTVLTA